MSIQTTTTSTHATRIRRGLTALVAALALTIGAAAAGQSAGAVASNNGVVNSFGYGQVFDPMCEGTYIMSKVRMVAGSGTRALAFRFWFQHARGGSWATTPWRVQYNAVPGVAYTWGGDWQLFQESVPLYGNDNYVVWAEFQFYAGGMWRTESVRIGGFYSQSSYYTGWYCYSEQD